MLLQASIACGTAIAAGPAMIVWPVRQVQVLAYAAVLLQK
jgi:hypothetical protein